MESSLSGRQRSNVSSIGEEYLKRAGELLAQACWATLGTTADFERFESTLLTLANEVMRQQLEVRLQQIADGHGGELLVGGKPFRRHEAGEVSYRTLVGEAKVRRYTYRAVGVRNGPTVVPLELAAKLIHRATPALAYSVALGYAAGPVRHYEKQMRAAYRSIPPYATMERLARTIGGCAAQDVVKIEEMLRPHEEVPFEAHAIVMSLDRTATAMAEERPHGMPPNSRRRSRSKPHKRRPPAPFDVNWRMIYVGTVSLVDENGDALVTRRYHATPEEETDEIMTRMTADIVDARRKRDLPVVVVQDGAPEMWNVVRAALRRIGVEQWTEIIDRYHVNERLAAVLELLEPDEIARRQRRETWQRQLDDEPHAIRRIVEWLEHKWFAMPRNSAKAHAVGGHVGYLAGYASQMNYAAFRRAGFPVGSGPVEGACKSLVGLRAKRSGQRWKQDGLTAVLTLRALEQSDRLTPFWNHFNRRFSEDVQAA